MKSKRNRLLHSDSDSDPMGTVANLFDVAMVFAVALMVALVSRFNMTEICLLYTSPSPRDRG